VRDCPSCGRSVSRDAASCPGCGHPFGPNLARMVFLGILVFLLIAAIALIVKETQVNEAIGRLGG